MYEVRYRGKPRKPCRWSSWDGKKRRYGYTRYSYKSLLGGLRRLSKELYWPVGSPADLSLWKDGQLFVEVIRYKSDWDIYRVRPRTSPEDTLRVYKLVKSGKVRFGHACQ